MTSTTSTPGPATVSRTSACTKQAPRLSTNKTFTFWRRRTNAHKSRSRVITAGDRRTQAEKRERARAAYYDAIQTAQGKIQEFAVGLRDRFGKHSTGHYYNDLIHRAHKSRSTRKVNQWNAYQKLELARMKRQYSLTLDAILTYRVFSEEHGADINLTAVNKEISESWRKLSPEERKAITAEPVQQLEEQRESRKLATHSVPLNSFHDARSTIQSIETQVSRFHNLLTLAHIVTIYSWRSCTRGQELSTC